jgi:hypothetical protein
MLSIAHLGIQQGSDWEAIVVGGLKCRCELDTMSGPDQNTVDTKSIIGAYSAVIWRETDKMSS